MSNKTPNPPSTDDRVYTLPYLDSPGNKVDGVQFAGYIPVTAPGKADKPAAKMFYWFAGTYEYASRPTIIWTNGGPGSSSFWGFFLENGPYEITEHKDGSLTLKANPNGWNQYANYMIFEHPLSVTMSFATKEEVPLTVEQGMDQYYQALLNFLAKHPEINNNPIILVGESYAGTYLPLLAQRIVNGNASGGVKINLATTVLLDAWVDPDDQMKQDTNYALYHGLISAEQKEILDKNVPLPKVNDEIGAISGVYMANIAEAGDPPFDPVMKYLNDDAFRKAVHAPAVGPGTTIAQNWSKFVSDNYEAKVNDSYLWLVQELLDDPKHQGSNKQKIVVISGLNDAKDCNFMGTAVWLSKLQGLAAIEFKATTPQQWKDPKTNRVIGFDQNGGWLRWLKVLNAGHLAVLDQPLLIYYILDAAGV